MFQRIKVVSVLFLGLSGTLAASGADHVLSVEEADRVLHPTVGAPPWRPWRISLAPARWIWLPSQRTLPNTFLLFRREVTLNGPPRRADGLDHGRQPLPAHGQRPAGPVGARPLRSAQPGRRSGRPDGPPDARART